MQTTPLYPLRLSGELSPGSTAGATDLSVTAQLDEVVRCYRTNTANTRP